MIDQHLARLQAEISQALDLIAKLRAAGLLDGVLAEAAGAPTLPAGPPHAARAVIVA